MLQALIEYAKQKKLSTEAGFSSRDAQWVIDLAADGSYLNVRYVGNTSTKGKRYGGKTFTRAPNLTHPELTAGSGGRSHFLLDSLDTVFYDFLDGEVESKQRRHEAFLQLHQAAADEVQELEPVAAFLQSPDARREALEKLLHEKAKLTDKVTFAVIGSESSFVPDWTCWHAWWREYRAALPGKEAEREMVCLATGENVLPALTHNKIRHLNTVGGLSMGDALVSFKMDSFCSYGLKQSENAAVSEAGMIAYTEALNHLLTESSVQFVGTRVAWWYDTGELEKLEQLPDLIAMGLTRENVLEKALNEAKKLLQSVHSGKRPVAPDYQYYVVTLSANSGRVVIRDWMQGPFEELVKAFDAWYKDRETVGLFTPSAPRRGLEDLVTCTLPPRGNQQYADWIKPVGAVRQGLWQAMLKGTPIPDAAIGKILLELQNTHHRNDWDNPHRREKRPLYGLFETRMQLIAAYIRRNLGIHNMDDLEKSVAYNCGRLLMLYSRLQRTALGDVGAGVVQRYYGSASTTPAYVFGQLNELSEKHLSKLSRQGQRGAAFRIHEQIAMRWDAVRDRIPATFTMEDKTLFAQGYHHQLAETLQEIERRKQQKAQREAETESTENLTLDIPEDSTDE